MVGSQLGGDHGVVVFSSLPAGEKKGREGHTALPFVKIASGFSSQTDPQIIFKSLKGSGGLHVPLLC